MAIIYTCRHCSSTIGKLNEKMVPTEMLGFDMLSPTDKQQMIQYKENGDIHIKAICEDCEDSLKQHPDYYELEYFIQ